MKLTEEDQIPKTGEKIIEKKFGNLQEGSEKKILLNIALNRAKEGLSN